MMIFVRHAADNEADVAAASPSRFGNNVVDSNNIDNTCRSRVMNIAVVVAAAAAMEAFHPASALGFHHYRFSFDCYCWKRDYP